VLLLHPTGPAESVLGGSRWAVERRGHRSGRLPALDLEAHRSVVQFACRLVAQGVATGTSLLCGVHDVSAGGLGVALAEMALAAGVGVQVEEIADHASLFAEVPSRFLAATDHPAEVIDRAGAAGVAATVLGRAGGDELRIGPLVSLPVARLAAGWTEAIPAALGERR
jgi:phosphoribosylformylglycinamidine (FGAM) synthase-like enzyme